MDASRTTQDSSRKRLLNHFLGTEKKALFTLIVLCLALRVGLWVVIQKPSIYLDSEEYIELAQTLQWLDLSHYNGFRTPIYSLVILLFGFNYQLVFLFHNVLGILMSLLLFKLAYSRTSNTHLALLAGFLSSLSLYRLYYESVVMTETLAAFLLVLTLYYFFKVLRPDVTRYAPAFLLGGISALAGFTRPQLLFLTPLFVIMYWAFTPTKLFRSKIIFSLGLIGPYLILILGWSTFNGMKLGYFTPTTLTGYNLANHSTGFMEKAPDRYSPIRDIFLKYKQETLRVSGSYYCTVYNAETEICSTLGLSQAQYSQQMARISLYLFVHYPLDYFKSVIQSFVWFWDVAKKGHWDPLQKKLPVLIIFLEIFGILTNASFFFLIAWGAFNCFNSWRRRHSDHCFEFLVGAVVLAGALVQALVEHGDNRRYAIPFHPLIWYVVLVSGWNWLSAKWPAVRNRENKR